MGKSDNSGLIVLLVIVAVVAVIFYLSNHQKEEELECNVDSDCPRGYVCTMDGICILPDIVDERQRDNYCADNTYPDGNYDPDCPKYCPSEFERASVVRTSGMGMCCLNREMTITIDCETGVPLNLFPEVVFGIPEQRPAQEWYDMVSGLQAFISFVPRKTEKSFEYVDYPITLHVDVTTGKTVMGSDRYEIWMKSIQTKSRTTGLLEPVLTDLWNDCQITGGSPCIGESGSKTMYGGKTCPKVWSVDIESIEAFDIDEYNVTVNYCGIAIPESLNIPKECHILEYDLDIGDKSFSPNKVTIECYDEYGNLIGEVSN